MKCFTPALACSGEISVWFFKTVHAAVDLQLLPPVTSLLFALPGELVIRVRNPPGLA